MKNIILLSFCLYFSACNNKQKAQNLKIQEAVNIIESKKKPFDPNINYDSMRRKLFLTFSFENGQISPKPINIEIVGGSLPQSPMKSGFKVIYKNANKKELGAYFMENPMIIRSCDDPTKPPTIKNIEKGQIFVQVPYSDSITYLEISNQDNNTKPVEINLLEIIKEWNRKRK